MTAQPPEPPKTKKPRSLLPREHGVYAEVAFPLITALALGGLSLSVGLLATAIVATFLAHEPVLVLLGRRGVNLRERLQARAQRRLYVLGAMVSVAGLVGLWFAPPPVWLSIGALSPLAAMIGFLVVKKREKTWLGESLVAVVFSMLGTSVSLAAGIAIEPSIAIGLVWSFIFLLGTASVHAIFARKMRKTETPTHVTSLAALLSIGLAAIWAGTTGQLWPLAVVPAALLTVGVGLAKMQPKRLRAVGFMLVGVDLVSLTWLLAVIDV